MEFKNGKITVKREMAINLMFHPHCAEFKMNMAVFHSFKKLPYKSFSYNAKYVGNLILDMEENGIEINLKNKK